MTKQERYLRNQESIKSKAIYKILQKHKNIFCDRLEKEDKISKFREKKSIEDDIIDPFLDETMEDIPEYFLEVLPKVMNEGAKDPIKRYKDLLPENYALIFNVSTEPATIYLKNLEELMLSQRSGSILKTTNDELRQIMIDGISEGQSYTSIAKQIREVDPWVFSKARSKTIAVNELGRAYGWANHEPGQVLTDDGYILTKEWATSEDDKVRPTHMTNQEAGAIPFDDEFPGTGDKFGPSTNDINCRCTSTHQITGIKDGKSIIPIQKGVTGRDIKKLFDSLRNRV